MSPNSLLLKQALPGLIFSGPTHTNLTLSKSTRCLQSSYPAGECISCKAEAVHLNPLESKVHSIWSSSFTDKGGSYQPALRNGTSLLHGWVISKRRKAISTLWWLGILWLGLSEDLEPERKNHWILCSDAYNAKSQAQTSMHLWNDFWNQ